MALSNADKQRAYRRRKDETALYTNGSNVTVVTPIEQLQKDVEALRYRNVTIMKELQRLREAVTLLGNEIAKITLARACAVNILPSESESTSLKKKRVEATVRGTRLLPTWEPDTEDRELAIAWSLDPDVKAETFRNHWCSKTGKDATKIDWKRTWRNWVMNDKLAKKPNGHANGHIPVIEPISAAEAEDISRRILESVQRRENAQPEL